MISFYPIRFGNLNKQPPRQCSIMRTLSVGDAKVSAFNLGNFGFRLKDEDNVPESEWRPKYTDVFENVKPYPSQCFLIIVRDVSVLVDPGDYSRFANLGPEYVIPNYNPPPGIIDQLRELGVAREEVNYVVITHGHIDHYAGVTIKENSKAQVPTFPRALHFFGKQDFESADTQNALRVPNSIESETIGVLLKNGLLELVENDRQLSDEVEIIAAPGETMGHKIVKIASRGDTLYCVGDLFHHAAEVENISWMAKWGYAEKNLSSRRQLIESALKENALLAAAHMPLGRLEKSGSTVKFVEV
jgi:glyoxylase-like metal-dependent hydrolase (beta-lactamase superfamily II)